MADVDLVPSDERPIEGVKQYTDLQQKVRQYVLAPARDAESTAGGLTWIAIGGLSTDTVAELQQSLEAIGGNALELAEQVDDLDDPRAVREELWGEEKGEEGKGD